MHASAKLAFGIALMWIAGVLVFIAFHPGGIQMKDGNTAGNPADVLRYLISQRGTLGDFSKAANSNGTTGTTQGNPATVGKAV